MNNISKSFNRFMGPLLILLCCGHASAQVDLALNKVTAASTAALPSSYAVDGNGATRWGSTVGIDPSWLSVDLGSNKSLASVVIDWEAANAANYRVEGSTNNSTWITLATRTGGTFGNRTDTVPVAGSYRYVRIYGTARSPGNSWGYSIWSFKVYGAASSSSSSSSASSLPTAYSGYTGVYPGYTLKLDERFDSFNTNVWARGDGAVGSESICRFQPQGVQIVNGNLELVVRNEYVPGSYSYDHKAEKGPYNFSCGELRTVPAKRIKYGRIETRMKAPARAVAKGYISSLFTYVHEGSPREWEEIDVELEGSRPDKFQANLIYGVNVADWNGTRQWGAWEHKIDIAPADQWRVYAIEWAPTFMKWYVDGVLVKTLNQDWLDCNPSCVAPQVSYTPVPDNLTDLMMNFWIPNDSIQNAFGGNKAGNVYPMTTQYDWVRIYSLNTNPLTNW
jgi:beta-glucanase (GH16 family)